MNHTLGISVNWTGKPTTSAKYNNFCLGLIKGCWCCIIGFKDFNASAVGEWPVMGRKKNNKTIDH